MAAGFIVGARAARPDIKIQYAAVGEDAYADAASAKRVTETVIAAGADIIFGMGDGSTFGMIQAVENATPPKGADKVWFIDVIGDKTVHRREGHPADLHRLGLPPALPRRGPADEGRHLRRLVGYLDLDNGGISCSRATASRPTCGRRSRSARQGIIEGSITVPEIDEAGELKALLDQ